jgi:hypothetical protein
VELPHIEKLYKELKPLGFGLITVTHDPAPDVLKMVAYHQITHPIVSDTTDPATGKAFEKYHAYDGKHYLIGSNGRILAAFSKLGISIPILMRELARHGIGQNTSAAVQATPAEATAQSTSGPVAWSVSAKPTTLRPGGTLSVTLSSTLEEGWHLYSITQGSGGPVPLRLVVPKDQPFALAGKIQAPAPVVKFDQNFGMDVEQYQGAVHFVLPVSVAAAAAAGRQALAIEAHYQVCNASICLPPETATLKVPVTIAK